MGGEAGALPMMVGHQLEQARVGLEQREELHAGRQVAEEQVEVQQRLVGRGRLRPAPSSSAGISSVSSSRARAVAVER